MADYFSFCCNSRKGKDAEVKGKKKKANYSHAIPLHTYCSTWFPAVTVHPPILALQPSENTSVPGHSSAGLRRKNNSKGLSVIAQCSVKLIQETHHRNTPSIQVSHTKATLANRISLKDANKNDRLEENI